MVFPTPKDEAKALSVKGDIQGAIHKFNQCLNGDFFDHEVLFMLGGCFIDSGLHGLGAVLTSAAIDAREAAGRKFPEAMMNLGFCYKAEHKNEIAARIWNDALKYETDARQRARIMQNISGLYINEGAPAQAVEWCNRALKEDPYNAGAVANRGLAYLEMGKWREGWRDYQKTYAASARERRQYTDIPEWKGEAGRTVIVYGDQGVGDEIYFASCLNEMIAASKKVIFDCHPRLEALFRRSFPKAEVHGTRKHLSELTWFAGCGAEASCCLADLPMYFRNAGEWDGAPYLATEQREMPGNKGLRIGLSWTGGSKKTRTDLRSLPLEALEPIIKARPEAQWFSLQYTPDAARQVCELEERTGVRIAHYPGWVECYDYDRTASFVASLDLIVTVCTTVHHLGGAMGVPTWTLVPSRPSWRYQIAGETLPWYRSARLFRQREDGDWSHPIGCIVAALAEL